MKPFKYGCVVEGENFCARKNADEGKTCIVDELVYEWQRSWRFVDPFFREWVRRKI